MEARSVVPYARAAAALTAFFLLFYGIVNLSAGNYVPALLTLVVGLAGTAYVLRTRRVPT